MGELFKDYFPDMFLLSSRREGCQGDTSDYPKASTLLDARHFPATILREGAVSRDDLKSFL